MSKKNKINQVVVKIQKITKPDYMDTVNESPECDMSSENSSQNPNVSGQRTDPSVIISTS